MSGKAGQIRICMTLLMLNLLFIWGNSLLPAEVSQSISGWVAEILPIRQTTVVSEMKFHLIRKLAHFLEFTALGLLLRWLLYLLQKHGGYALLLGLTAACVDEIIQTFVPGRGPGLKDVGIDACGVMAGMILMQAGYYVIRKIQNKQIGG